MGTDDPELDYQCRNGRQETRAASWPARLGQAIRTIPGGHPAMASAPLGTRSLSRRLNIVAANAPGTIGIQAAAAHLLHLLQSNSRDCGVPASESRWIQSPPCQVASHLPLPFHHQRHSPRRSSITQTLTMATVGCWDPVSERCSTLCPSVACNLTCHLTFRSLPPQLP